MNKKQTHAIIKVLIFSAAKLAKTTYAAATTP